MKITKLGHCCLIIETQGKRIMTDPGVFTSDSHVVEGIDLVLITHEHGDHVHVESLKKIIAKNPKVTVVTNSGVGKLLDEAGIKYKKLEGKAATELMGIALETYDAEHAEIFEDYNLVQNTGYFIDKRLFYPGDAYGEPGKDVEILALPAGGPWCRTTDALHYAIRVNPKEVFPVHDAIEREDRVSVIHNTMQRILEENNIKFTALKPNESIKF